VVTPSIALKATTVGTVTTNHKHASNPNPQAKNTKFRSIRDIGLNLQSATDEEQNKVK
jgi:hypothetical protein